MHKNPLRELHRPLGLAPFWATSALYAASPGNKNCPRCPCPAGRHFASACSQDLTLVDGAGLPDQNPERRKQLEFNSPQMSTVVPDVAFPTLRLRSIPFALRPLRALSFLVRAWRVIENRKLLPTYTFHIATRTGGTFSISSGDTIYPLAPGATKRIEELIVALEDKRFFRHKGVDARAICRAMIENARALRIKQGAGTITQQLVRNTLLTPERSVLRKLLEILLALKLERHYSKQEILSLYCEFCYTGPGHRGFEAAARAIFRRPLHRLSDAETCAIAGLIRRPEAVYPRNDARQLAQRQLFVTRIARLNAGSIDIASINPIHLSRLKRARLTRLVRREIFSRAIGGPLNVARVETTIDGEVQRAADDIAKRYAAHADISTIAIIVMDNESGGVLAESAWAMNAESEFSPSFDGRIQAGSTFKTFALLSALEQGFSLELPLLSAPFQSSTFHSAPGVPWKVRNYGHEYFGPITLLRAFVKSDNTAFGRLAEMIDIQEVYSLFRRFQLLRDDATPSLVLGSLAEGVRLIDLAAAYCAIARNGSYRTPHLIRGVEFRDKTFLSLGPLQERLVIGDSSACHSIRYALSAAGLTTSSAAWAGKSGTTRDSSLYVGYNERISAAILVGFRSPQVEHNPKGITAAHILDRIAQALLGHRSDLLSI